MYLRAVHTDATIPTLRQLIRQNPLGILTTAISSKDHPLILASHIPFVLDVTDHESETELGVLRGHLARANPQSKVMIEAVSNGSSSSGNFLEQEVQVLFHSNAHHYITPKFYTQTKPDSGKVVPTWNYAAAQVYGRSKIYCDSSSQATGSFLAKQIDDLSRYAEEQIMGYTGVDGKRGAWQVSDAPDEYIRLLSKAIIGIEVQIERLEGKFKMSQEMGRGDRDGVIDGLEALGSSRGVAVAALVKERGRLKDEKSK